MKQIGLFIGFLAVLAFMLPGLPAQDEKKKDGEKTEKKDLEKKDEKKDPEKKDEKKTDPKKEPEPKKEKLVHGAKFRTKILGFKGDSNRDLNIETQVIDEKKVQDMQNWAGTRLQQLGQQQAKAAMIQKATDRVNALNACAKDYAVYQQDLAKRQANLYSPKAMEVKAHETAKIRALAPPVEFDDTGNIKKWTKKELEERKDKSGLPGYPVEFDALKAGQYVEIYMAKVPPMAKKKKGDDDEPPMKDRNEYVLIVIMQEAK